MARPFPVEKPTEKDSFAKVLIVSLDSTGSSDSIMLLARLRASLEGGGRTRPFPVENPIEIGASLASSKSCISDWARFRAASEGGGMAFPFPVQKPIDSVGGVS